MQFRSDRAYANRASYLDSELFGAHSPSQKCCQGRGSELRLTSEETEARRGDGICAKPPSTSHPCLSALSLGLLSCVNSRSALQSTRARVSSPAGAGAGSCGAGLPARHACACAVPPPLARHTCSGIAVVGHDVHRLRATSQTVTPGAASGTVSFY